ncbi:MAG: ATP-binding protein [Leptospiraceae bacterium]|nr:ATP-binding protein [Leptospiraceae bacterium]MDW7975932.1 ATP-binding protein [Leptospiraceae bacterium]
MSDNIDNVVKETPIIAKGFDYETSKKTDKKIRMQIVSTPSLLKPFRNFVYEVSVSFGIKKEIAFDLKLISNEVVSNIIKHAYRFELGWIFFEFLFHRTYVELRFRDFGKYSVQPTDFVMKDLSDIRDRGIGLYLISNISDYYYIKNSEEMGNLFIVKKRI